jgi:hypothetical protein
LKMKERNKADLYPLSLCIPNRDFLMLCESVCMWSFFLFSSLRTQTSPFPISTVCNLISGLFVLTEGVLWGWEDLKVLSDTF